MAEKKEAPPIYSTVLPGEVVFKPLPNNVVCSDPAHANPATKVLHFGEYAFINKDSGQAICTECGVKRRWSSKDRVNKMLGLLEITEDVKSLKMAKKDLEKAVSMLTKEVDLLRLGEHDQEIDRQRQDAMNLVLEYIRNCAATPKEKEMFDKMFKFVEESKERQDEMRLEISKHMHWFVTSGNDIGELRKKRKQQQEQDREEEQQAVQES